MSLTCLNNIQLCFLPVYTSHSLQPLDNGLYNAFKAVYCKHLQALNSLTDAAPVDKINFIQCYKKAKEDAFIKTTLKSGFKVTGNWLISRRKAL